MPRPWRFPLLVLATLAGWGPPQLLSAGPSGHHLASPAPVVGLAPWSVAAVGMQDPDASAPSREPDPEKTPPPKTPPAETESAANETTEPKPDIPPPVKDPADADSEGAPRAVALPENGDLRRKLDRIRAEIADEKFADATRELGSLLQDPTLQDFFLNRDEQRRGGRGFLAEVRRLLHDLPPAGQTAYRTQFETLARGRLNQALAAGGEAGLREVAARFPETKAGNDALLRLAYYLRDHGRPAAARDCLRKMSFRPDSVADDDRWNRLLQSFAPPPAANSTSLQPALLFRGHAARHLQVPAQPPCLAARWSRPLTSDTTTLAALDATSQTHRQGQSVFLPLLSPLSTGPLIFTRTRHGVAAFDFDTGQRRWSCPSPDDTEHAGIEHLLWTEPVGGSFALDDECVYFLDNPRLVNDDDAGSSFNELACHEHAHGREGNLRWRVGGHSGGDERRVAGAYFLGPPLAWQGSLYLLAELKGSLTLLVLDRGTGRLAWSRELAVIEQGIASDPLRRAAGATPSISANEIILCPTSGGALIAVDLTTHSLLWAYRYPREVRPSTPAAEPGVDEPQVVEHLGQSQRWLDSTVAILDQRVFVTPPESSLLHCLDLESGLPLWTAPRGQGLLVAGLTAERLLILGRQDLRALQPATGEPLWTFDFPAMPAAAGALPPVTVVPPGTALPPATQPVFPAGRGVLAETRYFLPVTSAALWEIDLTTGALVTEHKSPRETLLGNLVWRDGRFISFGPHGLEVFDERDALAQEIATRLQRDPRDVEALLRQGDLALTTSAGVTAALDSFRTAHEVSPTPRTRARLTSALLTTLRQHPEHTPRYSAELDALLVP
ncbi:MAG: PQQ-binding-like beta-propeller repeat protein [Planctomycetes bacterium]|nr:PQQ-binding-like beta-propeller repeat protein [Planctomycetota bacterium]